MHKTQIKENQAKNTKPDLKNDKGEWICRKMVKTVKYQMLNFHFFFQTLKLRLKLTLRCVKKCTLTFNTREDLEHHKKTFAHWRCEFCEINFMKGPELTKHERDPQCKLYDCPGIKK